MNRKNFDPTYTKHYDKAKFIQLFCEKLKRMRQWYMENRNSMLGAKAYIEGHYNYTEKLQDEYEEKYNILSEDDRGTLNSMSRRANNTLTKLSKLTAIANFRKSPSTQDIDKAFLLLSTCLDSVRNILINMKKEDKQMDALVNLLKSGSLNSTELSGYVKTKIGITSPNTISKLYKKAVNLGYLTKFENGRYTMHMLTELGRDYAGDI